MSEIFDIDPKAGTIRTNYARNKQELSPNYSLDSALAKSDTENRNPESTKALVTDNPEKIARLYRRDTTEYEYFKGLTFVFEVRDAAGQVRISPNGKAMSLVFSVNPNNFDRSFKKTVDRVQTLGGWVEYHGGDELDTINVSGVVSAFVDQGGSLTNIQYLAKHSHGWEEYEKIVSMFRNNGNSYDDKGMIYETGNIVLTYDNGVYTGLFESLNITESSEKPFSVDYSFSFVVERTLYTFRKPITKTHKAFL